MLVSNFNDSTKHVPSGPSTYTHRSLQLLGCIFLDKLYKKDPSVHKLIKKSAVKHVTPFFAAAWQDHLNAAFGQCADRPAMRWSETLSGRDLAVPTGRTHTQVSQPDSVLKSMYHNDNYILVDGDMQAYVRPTYGVKQGCPTGSPLSPLLFSIYLDDISEVSKVTEGACTGTPNFHVSNLLYADDLC
eukprot:1161696-Pelagomonas_calceolata.AAC.1